MHFWVLAGFSDKSGHHSANASPAAIMNYEQSTQNLRVLSIRNFIAGLVV